MASYYHNLSSAYCRSKVAINFEGQPKTIYLFIYLLIAVVYYFVLIMSGKHRQVRFSGNPPLYMVQILSYCCNIVEGNYNLSSVAWDRNAIRVLQWRPVPNCGRDFFYVLGEFHNVLRAF